MKKLSLLFVSLILISCDAQEVTTILDDTDERAKARAEAQQKLMEDTSSSSEATSSAALNNTNDESALQDEGGQTDMIGQDGAYTAYYDGVVGNGMESVLFFHADWCPKCRANDAFLTEWYANNTYPRSVYKLDYDSNSDLRAEFGVTSQDTFVLLDGNGMVVETITFPTEQQLEDLLG